MASYSCFPAAVSFYILEAILVVSLKPLLLRLLNAKSGDKKAAGAAVQVRDLYMPFIFAEAACMSYYLGKPFRWLARLTCDCAAKSKWKGCLTNTWYPAYFISSVRLSCAL